MIEIKHIDTYIMVTNGNNVFNIVKNTINTITSVGQPFIVAHADLETLKNIFFSNIVYDELTGEEISKDINPFIWGVGYTEEGADNVVNYVNTSFGTIDGSTRLYIDKIKHPNRDEWAIPSLPNVIDILADGDAKDNLINMFQQAEAEGKHKTTIELIADGWF